jgi:hypothetical protein
VNTQQPITSDQEHRVLKFRPRTLAHPPGRRGEPGKQAHNDAGRPQSEHLSRSERGQEPDDFAIACPTSRLAFTVALTAIEFARDEYRRSAQDPGLRVDGRRDCAHFDVTH